MLNIVYQVIHEPSRTRTYALTLMRGLFYQLNYRLFLKGFKLNRGFLCLNQLLKQSKYNLETELNLKLGSFKNNYSIVKFISV